MRGPHPQPPEVAPELSAAGSRQAESLVRRLSHGLSQVAVWVPTRRVPDLYDEARRLRFESSLTLPGEADTGQLGLAFDEGLP